MTPQIAQRVAQVIDQTFDAQQGQLFPWATVLFGCGIATFFSLRFEPDGPWFLGAFFVAVFGMCLARNPHGRRALGWGLLWAAAGFGVAAVRAHHVGAPVLPYRYYGPVEGRLVAVDRSQSDALRLTLDQVRLPRLERQHWPTKLRISARDLQSPPPIGARVMTTAHLSQPQGPVEPGGFDFRRHVWFQQIGAVGYTRVPVLRTAPPDRALWVDRLRARIGHSLQQRYPGATGGVAAAVLTGDRSGIDQYTLRTLRISNLAHLLAISGLHMGLLSGVVFSAARLGLVILGLATGWRIPAKSCAAALALGAATIYLLLSGGNVATERAYVMTAVVLVAVLLHRRAITLRAVAIAGFIVLVHRPESLLGPGFQMSFAATTALVSVFATLRAYPRWHWPRWIRPIFALVLSSAVAGLATAPIGAAHFNTLSQVGLIANLLAVPVMGSLVMPAAVLAALLAPLGLEALPLSVMNWGLNWILNVADWAAALPFAQRSVVKPTALVLPCLAIGALFLMLWQGRARILGAGGIVLALILWTQSDRPALLIASDGALVGLETTNGRALSRARGAGFTARVWMENDGAPRDQAQAAQMWHAEPIWVHGTQVHAIAGKRAAAQLDHCDADTVIVANLPIAPEGPCLVLDPKTLSQHGAVAITQKGAVLTARAQNGVRLWSPKDWHTPVSLNWPTAGPATP